VELKIISQNCLDSPILLNRGERINLLVNQLVKQQANIICLQEINFSKTAKRISEVFNTFGYHTYCLPKRLLNKGGLFVASLFPFNEKSFVRYSSQGRFFSNQLPDKILGKGYQKLNINVNGIELILINTHLVSMYNWNSKSKKEILRNQLEQLIGDIEPETRNLIVTGDFNFKPEDPLYIDLLNRSKLRDPSFNSGLITLSKDNTNKKGLYKYNIEIRYDYTFVSGNLKCKNQKVILNDLFNLNGINVNLSDHYGLCTELSI